MKANNMSPDQTDLGPYCLQYKLPKKISRQDRQRTEVVTGGLRVKWNTVRYHLQSLTAELITKMEYSR